MKKRIVDIGVIVCMSIIANYSIYESLSEAAEEASKIQETQLGEDQRLMDLEIEGELKSRQMEADKVDALMGLAAGDVSAANALVASAQQSSMDAMGDIAGGLGSAAGAYAGREK